MSFARKPRSTSSIGSLPSVNQRGSKRVNPGIGGQSHYKLNAVGSREQVPYDVRRYTRDSAAGAAIPQMPKLETIGSRRFAGDRDAELARFRARINERKVAEQSRQRFIVQADVPDESNATKKSPFDTNRSLPGNADPVSNLSREFRSRVTLLDNEDVQNIRNTDSQIPRATASVRRGKCPVDRLAGINSAGAAGAAGSESPSSSASSTPSDYKGGAPVVIRGNCGFANLGNSCFMNSVLQCLCHTRPLQDYFASKQVDADLNPNVDSGELVHAFADIINNSWNTPNQRAIAPDRLKRAIEKWAPQFAGYQQHDSQEFLTYMLDTLHECLNRVRTRPKFTDMKDPSIWNALSSAEQAQRARQWYMERDDSQIKDVFQGQLRSTLQCRHCGRKSLSFDPFWDLSLPIPAKDTQDSNRYGSKTEVPLDACFEEMTKDEVLSGSDAVTCESCKAKRTHTKGIVVQALPKVLIVHLKRHVANGYYGHSKDNTSVKCPVRRFSVEAACEGNVGRGIYYDLFAVAEHSGRMGFGHCTARCAHPYESEHWFRYNDNLVSQLAPQSFIVGSTPYILFYRRCQYPLD